jgi:anti-anti-sigma regulatory factor
LLTIRDSFEEGRVLVTILHIEGQVDSQNYRELISKTRTLYIAGTTDLLLDLAGLTYIGSAGLLALHMIALTFNGELTWDSEQEWSALKASVVGHWPGLQQHVKLLNPRPEVLNVLETVGFTSIFEIFSDRSKAVNSFS